MFPALADLGSCPHTIEVVGLCDTGSLTSIASENALTLVRDLQADVILGASENTVGDYLAQLLYVYRLLYFSWLSIFLRHLIRW
jgi:hypothetical protein